MSNTTLSIAVLSGKGGVGKSNLALNLCYSLHQRSHTVLLMDCDMGLANMDVLLGIAPESHLQDILLSNKNPREILMPIGPQNSGGFDLLPANSGMSGLTELDPAALEILRNSINPVAVDYDFLVLDIGAGISPTALGFGAMAVMRILVVTPEPTSLTDGYALMKVLSNKHGITSFHILVNQVESSQEGKRTFNRLSAVCEKFLQFTPTYLGHIRLDNQVTAAVRKQRPFIELYPNTPASLDCKQTVQTLCTARKQRLPLPLGTMPLTEVPSA